MRYIHTCLSTDVSRGSFYLSTKRVQPLHLVASACNTRTKAKRDTVGTLCTATLIMKSLACSLNPPRLRKHLSHLPIRCSFTSTLTQASRRERTKPYRKRNKPTTQRSEAKRSPNAGPGIVSTVRGTNALGASSPSMRYHARHRLSSHHLTVACVLSSSSWPRRGMWHHGSLGWESVSQLLFRSNPSCTFDEGRTEKGRGKNKKVE